MFYKFSKQNIQVNTLQVTPEIFYEFSDVSNDSRINNNSFTAQNLSNSTINLYEYNIDRQSNLKIYPFVLRNNINNFLDFNDSDYNNTSVGNIITGSYNYNVGIEYIHFDYDNRYKYLSLRNKIINMNLQNELLDQKTGILSSTTGSYFPAFLLDREIYGSKILEKSVVVKFEINFEGSSSDIDLADGYYAVEACDYFGDGKLYTKISDIYGNFPSNKEYVHVGYVFYSIGIIAFHNNTLSFGDNGLMKTNITDRFYTWKTFGHKIHQGSPGDKRQMKFSIKCNGVNIIQNLNIFCIANKNELNNSNNLTSIESNQSIDNISKTSYSFIENNLLQIKNMADDSLLTRTHAVYLEDSSDLDDITINKFEKNTYISEINIYDENFERIAIAKLSNPVKKREKDEYIFKIKADL